MSKYALAYVRFVTPSSSEPSSYPLSLLRFLRAYMNQSSHRAKSALATRTLYLDVARVSYVKQTRLTSFELSCTTYYHPIFTYLCCCFHCFGFAGIKCGRTLVTVRSSSIIICNISECSFFVSNVRHLGHFRMSRM